MDNSHDGMTATIQRIGTNSNGFRFHPDIPDACGYHLETYNHTLTAKGQLCVEVTDTGLMGTGFVLGEEAFARLVELGLENVRWNNRGLGLYFGKRRWVWQGGRFEIMGE